MKNFSFAFILLACFFASAFGAEVTERTDCAAVQSRISELAAMESPSAEQAAELEQLKTKYRTDCSKSASGRKTATSGRASVSSAVAVAAAAATPVVAETKPVEKTADDVLKDYLEKKQSSCDSLKLSIENFSGDEKSELQNQYDFDCKQIKAPEMTDEEKLAKRESGFCPDGEKPNLFGCCAGETFKDLGNLEFACCPDVGGDCFQPIKSGSML